MVLGGEASEGWLGHEGGALMNGIGALINETPRVSVVPSTWGYRCLSSVDQAAPSSQTSNLQSCEKYVSIVYKPPRLTKIDTFLEVKLLD